MIKGSEECRESLQLKRRRMLQFNSNMTDPCICNEQTLSTYVESKVDEVSLCLGNNSS